MLSQMSDSVDVPTGCLSFQLSKPECSVFFKLHNVIIVDNLHYIYFIRPGEHSKLKHSMKSRYLTPQTSDLFRNKEEMKTELSVPEVSNTPIYATYIFWRKLYKYTIIGSCES